MMILRPPFIPAFVLSLVLAMASGLVDPLGVQTAHAASGNLALTGTASASSVQSATFDAAKARGTDRWESRARASGRT